MVLALACGGDPPTEPAPPDGSDRPTILAFTSQPSDVAAGAIISPSVEVAIRDASGRTVDTATNAVTVAFGVNPGGGTLSGTTTVEAIGGVATFSDLSIERAGPAYVFRATSAGLDGASSAPFDVAAAAPVRLEFVVEPAMTTAAVPIAPAVEVAIRDAFGNLVTAVTGNVTLAIGMNPVDGTLSGTTTVTSVQGVAAFSDLSIDRAGTGYTLTATSDGLTGTASTPFDIVFGLTLDEPINVSNNTAFSQTASFARDGTGAINVVWEERRTDILFSRSGDAGVTFSPARYVVAPSDPLGADNDFSSGQMRVAGTTDGAIHVAWTIFDLLFGGAEIFYSRSTDGGASFSTPLIVSSNDGVNSFTPAIATDGTDRISIVWSDANLNTGETAVWHASSMDGGGTFSAPALIADAGACPDVATAGDDVYTVWTEGPFGLEEIFFSRSADGGATFTSAVAIDRHANKSWCPRIVVGPAGTVFTVWEEGSAGARDVLFARSADGTSFDVPVAIATDAGCPSIAVGDAGRVLVAWAAVGVFLASSMDGGATFSPPIEIPLTGSDTGCAHVTAGPLNAIGVGWRAVGPGRQLPDIFHAIGHVTGH